MSSTQRLILALVALLALAALGAAVWLILQAQAATPQPAALLPSAPPSATAPPKAPQPPEATAAATSTATALLETLALPSPAPFDPLACLPQGANSEEGLVKSVLSGGILEVELGGKTAQVSLLGVQAAGSGAQEQGLLRELAEGKSVRLLADRSQPDGAGRMGRYVLAGQVFLNFELVRRGAALPAQYPPGLTCIETLLSAERLARAEGKGYWSLAAPAQNEQPASTALAAACDCSKSYACSDFKTRAEAQACYNACGDYRNTTLDPDHNGIACETLP